MGVSGCTACQVCGQEALQAYDRAYQLRLDQQHVQAIQALQAPNTGAIADVGLNTLANQPFTHGTLGTHINLSA
jgi:hypothetical protein